MLRSRAPVKGFGRKQAPGKPAIPPEDRREKAADSASRRYIRRIENLRRLAVAEGLDTSEWEDEFLEDVGQRLAKFGRSFTDPEKGDLSRPMSIKQSIKLGEIHRSLKKQRKNHGRAA